MFKNGLFFVYHFCPWSWKKSDFYDLLYNSNFFFENLTYRAYIDLKRSSTLPESWTRQNFQFDYQMRFSDSMRWDFQKFDWACWGEIFKSDQMTDLCSSPKLSCSLVALISISQIRGWRSDSTKMMRFSNIDQVRFSNIDQMSFSKFNRLRWDFQNSIRWDFQTAIRWDFQTSIEMRFSL